MKSRVELHHINQAQKLVDEFLKDVNDRFKQFNLENAKTRNLIEANLKNFAANSIEKNIKQLTDIQKQKLHTSVNRLKFFWKLKRQTDTLIPVYSDGLNSDSVNFFINKQNIKKNSNQIKQEQLLTAYQKNHWNDPIFTDPLFIQTVFGLYQCGKLNLFQFESLLIIYYARMPTEFFEDIPNLHFYSILDSKGDFTPEALEILIPQLPGYMIQPFNPLQINNFKLLMQAFLQKFPSENFFFTSISGEFVIYSLAGQLVSRKCILYNSETKEITMFSDVARNALILACFPLKDVIYSPSMAGQLQPVHIKKGMFARFRPGAVSYPDVPRNEIIHEMGCSALIARVHDWYHAQLLIRMQFFLQQALLRIVQLADEHILINCEKLCERARDELLSSVTWVLIDGEFGVFNATHSVESLSDKKRVGIFCEALNRKWATQGVNILLARGVTDLGLIVFIDMAINKKQWLNFGFNPEYLRGYYKKYYDLALQLQPHFTRDCKYNILLMRIYAQVGEENFSKSKELIDKQFAEISLALEFRRNNLKKFLGLADKTLPVTYLSEKMLLILLKVLLPLEVKTLHKDFDALKYNLFLKMIFLIHVWFGSERSGKFKDSINNLLETNEAINQSKLNELYEDLLYCTNGLSQYPAKIISHDEINLFKKSFLNDFEHELNNKSEPKIQFS